MADESTPTESVYDLVAAASAVIRRWDADDVDAGAMDQDIERLRSAITEAAPDSAVAVATDSPGCCAMPEPANEPLVKAERIARAFHESYERQAPDYGYQTREASAVPWDDVPERNRRLMIAVVVDLLDRGVIHE
jgi:hypothetical protein